MHICKWCHHHSASFKNNILWKLCCIYEMRSYLFELVPYSQRNEREGVLCSTTTMHLLPTSIIARHGNTQCFMYWHWHMLEANMVNNKQYHDTKTSWVKGKHKIWKHTHTNQNCFRTRYLVIMLFNTRQLSTII